jgi:hypothetical protein
MELEPAQLNREIAQLEADLARLDIERTTAAKDARRGARHRTYLEAAQWLRRPRATLHLWPWAVMTVGPLLTGVALLIVAGLFVGMTSIALFSALVGIGGGSAVLASLLYRPPDDLLQPAIDEAISQSDLSRSRLADFATRRDAIHAQLTDLLKERKQLAAGEKLQRAMLLQRDWKAMRATEWEDFLVEVCRTLGAHVERTPNSAFIPPGPTKPVAAGRKTIVSPASHLLVTFSPRRIAVAAMAGINPFHPAAVQQTLNELAQHNVDATAIIANTRSTAGSKELAKHRNCTLIGEDEFPDFVLGKVTI